MGTVIATPRGVERIKRQNVFDSSFSRSVPSPRSGPGPGLDTTWSQAGPAAVLPGHASQDSSLAGKTDVNSAHSYAVACCHKSCGRTEPALKERLEGLQEALLRQWHLHSGLRA